MINYSRNASAFNPSANQNFTYNADGTLDQITNVSDGSIEMEYFYDANKRVIKKEGRNGIDIYNYEYATNQVTEKYFFTVSESGFNQVYKYDNTGNVIELVVYDNVSASNPNGTLSATILYTYDTKNAAAKSLPKEYLFPKNNNNNVLTEKYNSDPVFTYSWQYNDANYPTKRTTSYDRTYEYQ